MRTPYFYPRYIGGPVHGRPVQEGLRGRPVVHVLRTPLASQRYWHEEAGPEAHVDYDTYRLTKMACYDAREYITFYAYDRIGPDAACVQLWSEMLAGLRLVDATRDLVQHA